MQEDEREEPVAIPLDPETALRALLKVKRDDDESTSVPSEWWCKRHRIRSTTGACCVHADVVAWTLPD